MQLSDGRGSSGFGPNPLSWPDFDAWSRLMHVNLDKWELSALRKLDTAYLLSLVKKEAK